MDIALLPGLLKSVPYWLRSRPSPRNHIFITGAPRSGTTLLKTILTAHSRIAGGDYESTGLFRVRDLYSYECGELTREQVHGLLRKSRNLIEFYDSVADALLAYWGGDIFVDKVWPHAFRLKFVVHHFPSARWLHIVRDGRDCYCSARKHPNVPQGKDLETFAGYWLKSNRLVEKYVSEKKRMTFRYEDLVTNARSVIPSIMKFLDLEVEEGQYYPAKTSRIPSIRKRRYHERLSQPLDIQSLSRHLSELSQDEIGVFNRISREGLEFYNYLIN